jgi:hypothetical protein
MQQERPFIKKAQFYSIYEGNNSDLVLEDKTKKGLEVRERVFDDKYGVESERGMIYDMNGVGHRVGIRWYFPKAKYPLEYVTQIAERIEAKYKAIREMTCPDD